MSIEKEFYSNNNNEIQKDLLASGYEYTLFDGTVIKRTLAPYECVMQMEKLEKEHEKNNEYVGLCSLVVTMYLPLQFLMIKLAMMGYESHPESTMMIKIAMTVFVYLAMHVYAIPSVVLFSKFKFTRFKWVRKWLMKTTRFRKKEENYEMLKKQLDDALKEDSFKHQYLAHFQLHMNHYQQVIAQWSEYKEANYNHIQYFQEKIDNLNTLQAQLIASFSTNQRQVALEHMKSIEISLININGYLDRMKTGGKNNEQFLASYQKYLEKMDLTHLVKLLPTSNHEEDVNQQINRQL